SRRRPRGRCAQRCASPDRGCGGGAMSERQDAERGGGGPSTMNGPARTERRGGLGRGLAALIPTGPPETDAPAPSRHGLGNRAADVVFGARRSDEESGGVATTGDGDPGSTGNTADVA